MQSCLEYFKILDRQFFMLFISQSANSFDSDSGLICPKWQQFQFFSFSSRSFAKISLRYIRWLWIIMRMGRCLVTMPQLGLYSFWCPHRSWRKLYHSNAVWMCARSIYCCASRHAIDGICVSALHTVHSSNCIVTSLLPFAEWLIQLVTCQLGLPTHHSISFWL